MEAPRTRSARRGSDAPRFDRLTSRLAPLLIDDVDTDQIIPAEYLKITDRSGLAEGLFAGWRRDATGRPRTDFVIEDPRFRGARVLLAGHNFGCGSSREHAPWALLAHGFRAVISTRFADIFRSNAGKNGLLTVTVDPGVHERLAEAVDRDPGVRVTIDLERSTLELPDGEPVGFDVDAFTRACLLEGVDRLGYLLAREDEIVAFEASHPPRFDTRAGDFRGVPS